MGATGHEISVCDLFVKVRQVAVQPAIEGAFVSGTPFTLVVPTAKCTQGFRFTACFPATGHSAWRACSLMPLRVRRARL